MKISSVKTPFLVLNLIILIGCKKHPFDYRSKFIGKYQFTIHKAVGGPPPYNQDTTYYCDGEVSYGSDKNSIIISFCGTCSYNFILYEDGGLGGCSGEFESTKKVIFRCWGGGLGAPSTVTVVGERK